MKSRADVAVIGGGIIGACCAYQLAKKGASVLLLEKRQFGSGASGCSAAMLECQTHAYRGDTFLSIATPSLKLFPSLYQELKALTGIDFEYDACGILNLAMTEDEPAFFKECVKNQVARGFRAEWLEPEEVEQRFPTLNTDYLGGAFYRDDGQINGEKFLQAVLDASRRKGVALYENLGAVTVASRGPILTLQSATQVFEANACVVAAGPWSSEVLKPLGLPVGIKPIRGQLIYYDTAADFLSSPVYTQRHGYVVPKRAGYTLVGTTVEDIGFDESVTATAKSELIEKARRLVPGLARHALRGTSAGLRPQSPDDYPIIGALPSCENIFLASGHYRNGMLLAPITADIITSLVFKEKPGVNIDPFSPRRFV